VSMWQKGLHNLPSQDAPQVWLIETQTYEDLFLASQQARQPLGDNQVLLVQRTGLPGILRDAGLEGSVLVCSGKFGILTVRIGSLLVIALSS